MPALQVVEFFLLCICYYCAYSVLEFVINDFKCACPAIGTKIGNDANDDDGRLDLSLSVSVCVCVFARFYAVSRAVKF